MKSVLTIAALFLVIASFSHAANAQGPGRKGMGPGRKGMGPGMHHGGAMMQAIHDAGVPDTTIEKIKTLNAGMHEKNKKHREEMAKLNMDLDVAIMSEKPDSEIKKLRDQITAMQSEHMTSRVNHLIEMRKLLKPEERKKVAEMLIKK